MNVQSIHIISNILAANWYNVPANSWYDRYTYAPGSMMLYDK